MAKGFLAFPCCSVCLLNGSSVLALAAIEFQPVTHEVVAEFCRDLGLQLFDLVGAELNDSTGIDIDQMIVVWGVGGFEASRGAFECMALHDALLFKRRQRPVDGRKRDGCIDLFCPTVQFASIRVVFGNGENLQNCGALTRYAYAAVAQDTLKFLDPILVLFHGLNTSQG